MIDQYVSFYKGNVYRTYNVKEIIYNPELYGFTSMEVQEALSNVSQNNYDDIILYEKQIIESLENLLFKNRWIKVIKTKEDIFIICKRIKHLEKKTIRSILKMNKNTCNYIYEMDKDYSGMNKSFPSFSFTIML